jgi:hypothetical protein
MAASQPTDAALKETSMAKSKGGGFRGHNAKTGPHQPIPPANRPPAAPRIVPRTRSSPKAK